MEIKVSKKLQSSIKGKVHKDVAFKDFVKGWKHTILGSNNVVTKSPWNYVFVFILFLSIFSVLILQLSNLQIVQGEEMLKKSEDNQVRLQDVSALRGVVFDRNGKKLVENIPSMSLYLTVEDYVTKESVLDTDLLHKTSDTLRGILGDHWKKSSSDGSPDYLSIEEKVYMVHKSNPYFTEILLATDLNNEQAIGIKARTDDLPGVYIDDSSKRYYPFKEVTSHILGYTGEATAEDLKDLSYLNYTDIVGRTGLERVYDKELQGEDGKVAWEVDSLGRKISSESLLIKESVPGKNMYLSIDIDMQNKLYEALANGVNTSKAAGGAAIIEDIKTGEILAYVNYPSYDNNMFVGGISSVDYNKLLKDKGMPLLNRGISAQVPPGSTFKTLVAIGALDAKAITTSTKYVSRRGYTFSSGASFQEYANGAYGVVNVIDALTVSSNIFFCELIRNWNMNSLVPYLDRFGIGKVTGIDLLGEVPGRLPSPANKIALANSSSPWLDPIWYPEGDSCNSVIGQGITLVTPIQMSNWMGAIANGGTLNTPHFAHSFANNDGSEEKIAKSALNTNLANISAIQTTREGMYSAVNGSRASIRTLAGLGVGVAAKTGTAEFGALNKKGEYEHTHSWVGGFLPYESPKYSFTVFLEDGGMSLNAVKVMKEMISWMVKEGKI